jgi:hypothetical protein
MLGANPASLGGAALLGAASDNQPCVNAGLVSAVAWSGASGCLCGAAPLLLGAE